jgi:hypothetical protein
MDKNRGLDRKRALAVLVLIFLAPSIVSAAETIVARTNPQRIAGGTSAAIGVKLTEDNKPVAGKTITFAIIDGVECGTLVPASAITAADGTARVFFNGSAFVENCVARIQAAEASASPSAVVETTVAVDAGSAPVARIDGISAIALILIVSFAIDRLIRGLFFLLSYSRAWSNAFPDPQLNDVAPSARAERNRKLIYFSLAALLAMVALGWFGRVRILAALGFTAVNPVLDIIVTGLILMGGADQAGQLLQGIGAPGAPGSKAQPTPIEITGRVTIDEQSRRTLAVETGDSKRGPQANHD